MKNVIKNEKTHGLMKAGLALLLSGSVSVPERLQRAGGK